MFENKRHLRRINKLLTRIGLYRHAFGPHFYRGIFSGQ
nr:antimicrobial peptide lynronne 2-containing protein [uncultured bacterium]